MGKKKNNRSWSQAETEKYYIETPKNITLREIAKIANRGTTTVANWSRRGQWVSKREKYWMKIQFATREKTTERISDLLSQQEEELAKEHLRHHQKFRKFAEMVLNTMIQSISTSDDPIAAVKKLKLSDLNHLSQICDRAIKGEESSTGLKQVIDHNTAAKTLESLGYVVIDPTQPPTDVN